MQYLDKKLLWLRWKNAIWDRSLYVHTLLNLSPGMPPHAVPNPSQIEVTGAIRGSWCVYNLSQTLENTKIAWCHTIGSVYQIYLWVGIWLVQRIWDEVKVLFSAESRPWKISWLFFFPAEGQESVLELGWCCYSNTRLFSETLGVRWEGCHGNGKL